MNRYFNQDLKSRIIFGFATILVIMFLVIFWGIFNFYRLNESLKQTLIRNYSGVVSADNMDKDLDKQLNSLILILFNGSTSENKVFNEARNDFYFWYEKACNSAYSEEEKNILDSLTIHYNLFITDVYYKMNPKTGDYLSLINHINPIKTQIYKLYALNQKYIEGMREKVAGITKTATFLMVLSLIGSIIGMYVFSSKFSGYIIRPLQNLTKSVQRISGGNFADRLEVSETDDELSNLLREFNKMSEKLQEYERLNVSRLITEKKKSEIIIESMDEPVIMIDKELNIVLTNKAFRDIFNFDKYRPALRAYIFDKDLLESIRKIDLQGKDHVISFDHKYYKIIYSVLTQPDSGIIGSVIVFNDITKFRELDNLKSEFIGKISHELKTPLTSLGMALGIMEDGVVGSITGKQRELIDSMKDDYNRLNKLVFEILELSKIESGILKLSMERVNPKTLVANLINKNQLLFASQKINVNTCFEKNEIYINANYEYLTRALENILSNSVKFTPGNGEIKIEITCEQNNVVISISDTGIGIAAEYLDKIFDKFIQIGDTKPGSIGLGLSIAKEIIELHGGEIKAHSREGDGSIFKIILPEAEFV